MVRPNKKRSLPWILSFLCLLLLFLSFHGEVEAWERTNIDMSFRDADLRDVFRILSELAEVNLLVHQDVTGRVTVRLDNLSFLDSLHLITQMYNIDFVQYKETFFVGPPHILEEVVKREKTGIFHLNFIPAQDVINFLSFLAPGVEIKVDTENKILILGGRKEDLEIAQEAIGKLDRETYLEEELFFYSLKYADGVFIRSMLREIIPGFRVIFDQQRDELIMRGISRDIELAKIFLANLDQEVSIPKMEYQVYFLEHIDIQVASSLITYLFPQLELIRDEMNKKLFLIGSKEDIEQAKEMLSDIDEEGTLTEEFSFYTLKHASGENVAPILTSLLPGLTIEWDEWSKKLVLRGEPQEIERAGTLLVELDQELSEDKKIGFYLLEHVDAIMVEPLLKTLFPQLLIDVYEERNEILLIGLKEDVIRAQNIIPILDRPTREAIETYFFQLEHAEGVQALSIIRALLPEIQVEIDERSNTLVLSGKPPDIERVSRILEELDQEIPSERRLEIRTLTYADGAQVASIIGSVIPDLLVEVETRSNKLILSGTQEDIEEAKELISALDHMTKEEHDITFYNLQYAEAIQISHLLSSLIPDLLVEVGGRNTIVLSGSSLDLERSFQILPRLDQQLSDDKKIAIYPLSYGEGALVGGILRSLLSDIVVEFDERSRNLILSGTSRDLDRAFEMLAKLDQEVPEDHQVEFYTLQYADGRQVANVLGYLVPELYVEVGAYNDLILVGQSQDTQKAIEHLLQLDRRVTEKQNIKFYPLDHADGLQLKEILNNLFPDLFIEMDRRSNNLILRGTESILEWAFTLLPDLDQYMEEEEEWELQIQPLQYADAITITPLLGALFPDLLIEIDGHSGDLVLRGPDLTLSKALAMVSQLDRKTVKDQEIRFFSLKYADPVRVSSILQSLFPDLFVETDPYGRELILRGEVKYLEKAMEILPEFDYQIEKEQSVSLYTLQYGDGDYIANLLVSLLPDLQVQVERQLRILILQGTGHDIEEAKNLAGQLDRKEEVEEDWEIKYYTLEHADPLQVASLLTNLIPDIRVEPDVRSNLLIMAGTNKQLAMTHEVIRSLDKKVILPEKDKIDEVIEDDIDWEMFVSSIEYGDAKNISGILVTFFPEMQIEVDERINTIVIGGTKRDVRRAKELISRLDLREKGKEEVAHVDIKVHDLDEEPTILVSILEYAQAAEVARVLISFLPDIKVEALTESNLLVLSGSEKLLFKAQDLIGQLDIRTLSYGRERVDLILRGITGDIENRIAFIASNEETFIVNEGDTILGFVVEKIEGKKALLRDNAGVLYALYLGGGFFEYR